LSFTFLSSSPPTFLRYSIYTGRVPQFQVVGNVNTAVGSSARNERTADGDYVNATAQQPPILEEGVTRAVEVLELADQFFLDHLKQCCERMLQSAVRSETYESLLLVAQKTNSVQLEKCCRHFARNRNEQNPFEERVVEEMQQQQPLPDGDLNVALIPSDDDSDEGVV